MSDPYQNDIDDNIQGKIDARKGRTLDPAKSWGQDYFYMKGYTGEKKRMESPSYCRIYGVPISIQPCYAAAGGFAVKHR